jgi:hypothetical protein
VSEPSASGPDKGVETAPDQPVAYYQAAIRSGGMALVLVMLWTPVVLGGMWLLVFIEPELKEIVTSTGAQAVFVVLLIASFVLFPEHIRTSLVAWTVFADRIEIQERALIPVLGSTGSATVPLSDIAVVRMGKARGGISVFEIETSSRKRFRLMPGMHEVNKDSEADETGFHAFIAVLQDAIEQSGLSRPVAEELRLAGGVILAIAVVMSALFAWLALQGVLMALDGDAGAIQVLVISVPCLVAFGVLVADRWPWRKTGR